ncbi:hypothetical protein PTSG_03143 [Salpingoeca rosetta]|uniref:Endonuclease/exonuclease/phosphatase domain-containing protein n=1 Tax=Salpingoeca rosetta (strain ATCC 50818 / BSB-021) TaxID=946362 RepID=F2U4C9_SALR5|nr:uncharacterized protein PTSG_03143 [Salpingoeca rosetta]EGD82495.1 hypothetical protein PTSG_03143 [Salpingoeca rosetta]|eukprot:XP_004995731.1 hypothetical protein PTSG_03143 [Salpingoeca rosetta]
MRRAMIAVIAAWCWVITLIPTVCTSIEVRESYGEVLNTFSWDVQPNDPDVQEAAQHALQHIWFHTNRQCHNPNASASAPPVAQQHLLQSAVLLFPSKHILYQTKDGQHPYVIRFMDHAHRVQRRTVILGITYYFTLMWEGGCASHWAQHTPDAYHHHFVVTKDRDKTLSVISHHVTHVPDTETTAILMAHTQLHPDDRAVFTEHNTWQKLRMLDDGASEEEPLPVEMQALLRFERGVVGRPHASTLRRPLRIASYNIWNINEFDDGTYEERLNRLAAHVRTEDPDVIAFQEVRHDALRDSQPASLAALLPTYHYVYQPAMTYAEQVFGRVEEGVAVFSKYPIVGIDYRLLYRNRRNHADAHQRVVLRVNVDAPHLGPVSIFVSHYALDETARQRGCVETWEFIKEDNSSTQLFLGDLNAEPDTPCIRFLSGKAPLLEATTDGVYDAWLELHPEPRPGSNCAKFSGNAWRTADIRKDEERDVGLTFNTFGEQLVKRIDYALMRHPHMDVTVCSIDVFPREREEHPASDHLGLVLELCTITPSLCTCDYK